jgi:hypothetical protein
MRSSKTLLSCVAAGLLSCSSASTSAPTAGRNEQTGAVGLRLTLAGGEIVSSLAFTLANGTPADTFAGIIPLPTGNAGPGPFQVPTYEIVPVVAASGYTITVSGTSTDGVLTCSGSSVTPFTVVPGIETIISVLVTCTEANHAGSVEVNGTLQNCPIVGTLTAIQATASDVAPGNTSTIYGSAVAPNLSSLAYAFSVLSGTGTLNNQAVALTNTWSSVVFTCPATPEVDTIQMVTSDQTGAVCPASDTTATVTVTCTPPPCLQPTVGTGVEATPDTAAGSCPAGQQNTGTLLDSQGNFCCSPIPCFGIGTGVEATPDTAAGLCPSGSAYTGSQDPQGNFCCSASPTVGYSVVRNGVIGGTQQTDGTATAAFVEKHTLNLSTDVDTLVSTIALPTASSGSQEPLAFQGVAGAGDVDDGALSLSVNGHYLTLVGYGAIPGTANIVTTNTVPRVVARIDALGNVDTSTSFTPNTAFVGGTTVLNSSFLRSSATVDGTAFWVSGSASTVAGSTTTGGIWYIPFGPTGGAAAVQLNSTGVRDIGIFGGQLYGDGDNIATSSRPEFFTVGTGTPTTGTGLPETLLPGFPMETTPGANDVSPWAFAFVGANTVYIASDQATGAGVPPNGIQKWTLSGGTWTMQTTFVLATNQPVSTPAGYRALAILASGGGITTFIGTTVEPGSPVPANHLAVFVDNGVYTPGGMTQIGVVYAQAPSNTVYKGLALSPR